MSENTGRRMRDAGTCGFVLVVRRKLPGNSAAVFAIKITFAFNTTVYIIYSETYIGTHNYVYESGRSSCSDYRKIQIESCAIRSSADPMDGKPQRLTTDNFRMIRSIG